MALTQLKTGAIADDAVTTDKLANAINTERAANTAKTSLEDESVTLAKLEHGTSSNDGKFLRANNGADPTFETVSAGPTVANQADNRVITATGTTDALNAESSLVFDGTKFGIGTHTGIPNTKFDIGLGVHVGTADDDASDWGADNIFQLTATGANAANNQVLLVGCHSGGVGQIGSGIGFGRDSTTNWGTYLSFKYHPTATSNIDQLKEGMRLTSGGNLLVNRTTDTSTASKIQTDSLDVYVGGDTTGISFDRTDAFQAWVAMRFRTYGSQRGYIQVNTDSTTYSTSSDYRLKENVVSISDGITRLKKLKPYKFNFKANPNKTVLDGFFAHEAAEVVPEAVVGTKDAVDDKGNIDPQGIDQAKLVPLLTAALQEAIAKIETLEVKVNTALTT